MEQVTLRADTGREIGSRPARRLRREGLVPAVVYGRGIDAISVAVDRRALYSVLHTEAGANVLINLEIGKAKHLTVAREIQRHPVRGEITHLDFLKISLDVPIEAEVSLDFVGTPRGVRDDGGIMEQVQNTVIIRALPTEIPSAIQVDVGDLGVGDSISVADVPAIEGIEFVSSPESTLATVVVPQVVQLEPEVEEEELLEEGELVEGEPEAAAEEPEGAAGGEEEA